MPLHDDSPAPGMLNQVGGFMHEVGLVVRSSHESYDGSGYPDGLSGEAIPLESRVVAACAAFNAMTTDRPYRRARPLSAAVAELRRCSATQFDPRVVEAVVAVVERDRPDGEDGALLPDPSLLVPASTP